MKHKELVQLIRRIAREEAYEVVDERLDDYDTRKRHGGDSALTRAEKTLVGNKKEKSP